jgi:hypothetical protein
MRLDLVNLKSCREEGWHVDLNTVFAVVTASGATSLLVKGIEEFVLHDGLWPLFATGAASGFFVGFFLAVRRGPNRGEA